MRRFVQINGVLYERGTEPQEPVAPMVMPDIAEYQSMVDGSLITSRSKHREHLREHGMVEVGNDSSLTAPYKGIPDCNPQRRKELLIAQVNAMTNDEFRAAGKRDLDRIRWQTRDLPDPLKEI